MHVDKITFGLMTITLNSDDLNALATACDVAVTEIVDAKEAALRAHIEGLGSTFVAGWYATRAQMDAVPVPAGDGDGTVGDE